MLSILTPAFNESENLPQLYARLVAALDRLGLDWEWVIVDDHSRDDTIGVVEELTRTDPRVRGVRLSRNSGSHLAIACALHHARGEAAVMMAADLQDPPETIEALVAEWRKVRKCLGPRARAAGAGGTAALPPFILDMLAWWADRHAGARATSFDRPRPSTRSRCDERNVSVLAW